jgi:sterol 3beta-glucosyltransferase
MQISLIAYGTRGDVQPALAIGQALAARGHAVRLLASANFKDWIEQHGLAVAPATVDIQALMAGALGGEWSEVGNQPLKQMQVIKKLLDEHGPAMMRDAWQGLRGSDLILSSFTSQNFAPALARSLGARHMLLLLQPPMLPSRSGPATLSAPLPGTQSWLNYAFGRWFIEPAIWGAYGPSVNRFRRETLGLPAQSARQNAAEWQRGPVLLGYSARVAPPAPDWPANIHQTGYWWLDEPEWHPPAALLDFLAAGERPV